VVRKQYPVEAQCQVQSQGDKNEAAVHFLAAKRNREQAKTALNSKVFVQPTKSTALERIGVLTKWLTVHVPLSNSLFRASVFPLKKWGS
jgi:hypothetical protein